MGVVDEGFGFLTGGTENISRGKAFRYKGRLQLVKNGSRRFLVLPKNYAAGGGLLTDLVLVDNSGIAILGINGEGFERFFESSKQKGFLTAFRVVPRQDNTGADVHILRTDKDFALSAMTEGTSSFSTYFWKAE